LNQRKEKGTTMKRATIDYEQPRVWQPQSGTPRLRTVETQIHMLLDAASLDDRLEVGPMIGIRYIERALVLWSNEGDVVLSPFMGIGSEGYQALKAGRRFIGVELKDAYWRQACDSLRSVSAQHSLFAA
jgi:hypothetical protein